MVIIPSPTIRNIIWTDKDRVFDVGLYRHTAFYMKKFMK